MAAQVGPAGRVVSVDVDTRFQPASTGVVEVRQIDVTSSSLGSAEFDLVHARALLQHVEQRDAVLGAMIAAARPGGWVVVTDTDWVQFDAQPVQEPFATLSRVMREVSEQQHGYDGTWGRMLVSAFERRGLVDVEVRGRRVERPFVDAVREGVELDRQHDGRGGFKEQKRLAKISSPEARRQRAGRLKGIHPMPTLTRSCPVR